MGYLVWLDGQEVLFQVKRLFYLVDVSQGAMRGKHAYQESHKCRFVCMVRLDVRGDLEEMIYELNDSKVGLFLQPEV